MAVDVSALIKQLIENILGNHDVAAQYAQDPQGTLAAQGITEHDLSGVDMPKLVGEACGSAGVPESTRAALQSYTSGSPSSSGGYPAPSTSYAPSSSVDQVMQHLNYVTYVAYQDDHSITTELIDHSTNIDQHQDISLHDTTVDGNLSFDQHNANALGDRSVAGSTNDGNVVGVTGDHSQATGGDNFGQMVNGTGNVTAGGELSNEGALNTGTFTGVQAGHDATNSVVGDHNTTANVDGTNDGTINFGSGDVTNVTHSDVHDSAIAGHDATNVSDNIAQGGSAIGGHDASGSYTDSHDTTTNTSTVTATNSQVETAQGNEGDTQQHQDSHVNVDFPHREPPVLEEHHDPQPMIVDPAPAPHEELPADHLG